MLPRLPVEIWERVIDTIASLPEGWSLEETRAAHVACCLTCRSWLSRSRWHLFSRVTIQSSQHLAHISRILSANPALGSRVWDLRIEAAGDHANDDLSWISLVPLKLASHLKSLRYLMFHNIDLRRAAASLHFYTPFSLFRPIIHLWFHLPPSNPFSQYLCLAQLASVTHTGELYVKAGYYKLQGPRVDTGLSCTHGRLRLRGPSPSLRTIRIEGDPSVINFTFQRLVIDTPSVTYISVHTSWHYGDTLLLRPHIDSLRCMVRAFQRLCGYDKPPRLLSVCYLLDSVRDDVHPFVSKCDLFLSRSTISLSGAVARKDEWSLNVEAEIAGLDHEDVTSISRLMSAISSVVQLDSVEMSFATAQDEYYCSDPAHPILNTFPVVTLSSTLARWKLLDNVLARPAFSRLKTVDISNLPMPEGEFSHLGDCVVHLAQELLPKLASRGVIVACEGRCSFHQWK